MIFEKCRNPRCIIGHSRAPLSTFEPFDFSIQVMSSSIVVHSCTMLHPPTTRFKSGLLCLHLDSSIVSVGVHTIQEKQAITWEGPTLQKVHSRLFLMPFWTHVFIFTVMLYTFCVYIHFISIYRWMYYTQTILVYICFTFKIQF